MEDGAAAQRWSFIAVIFAQRQTSLLMQGLHDLRTIHRTMRALLGLRLALRQPDSVECTIVKELEEPVMSTFLAEDALKEELARYF